jgi:hypothetical protein
MADRPPCPACTLVPDAGECPYPGIRASGHCPLFGAGPENAADPVAVALGLGDLAADVPRGDPLATLKAKVEEAEPDDRPAVAARMVRAMAAGMDDAARLAARAWIKQRKLFPVAEFDKLASIHGGPPGLSAQDAHLHTPDPAVLLYGAISAPDFSGDAPAQVAHVHDTYQRWFGKDYDTGALDVVLCSARADKLAGDPPWVLNVAGSGCAKTETVTPLAAAGARLVSMLSGEAALLSATPADKRAREATGGLLRELGGSGVLVIKDFTSVLSMHRDSRAKVISALREIHDGYWVRDVGADGGLKIPWAGRIIIIAACTTAWDAHREVVAAMGDRFLVVRQQIDRDAAGKQAVSNVGSERAMRGEIGSAVRGLLAVPLPDVPEVEASGDLLALADLVTRCRTPVERDYHGNPAWPHDLEAPTRFAKQLIQLARGGLSLSMTQDAARAVAERAARDSMPPLYLKVLGDLDAHPLTRTADVARSLRLPWRTADRALEELHLLGCLRRDQDPDDKRVYAIEHDITDLVKVIARKVGKP